jgi:hypothetical protein
MRKAPTKSSATSSREPALSAVISLEQGGPAVARELVLPADLLDPSSEAWQNGYLRKGFPDLPLARAGIRLIAHREANSARCTGFDLETTTPDGETTRTEFSVASLTPVAMRAAARLLEAGVLQSGQTYYYRLEANRAPRAAEAAPGHPAGVLLKAAALTYLEVPIRPLLEQGRPVDILDESELPVFYTANAIAQAQVCARRGGALPKPVESGCILNGCLAVCPRSRELFCVVTDVLEVLEAEEKTFSLSYSDRTWQRLTNIMRARQAAHPEWATRILGQAHGHNFTPGDGKRCGQCEKLPVCDLSTAHISADDQLWHKCVFARQPWALCHIFGLTARNEPVQRLHGLKDGRLQFRGYYIIPEFHPDQWPAKNQP